MSATDFYKKVRYPQDTELEERDYRAENAQKQDARGARGQTGAGAQQPQRLPKPFVNRYEKRSNGGIPCFSLERSLKRLKLVCLLFICSINKKIYSTIFPDLKIRLKLTVFCKHIEYFKMNMSNIF